MSFVKLSIFGTSFEVFPVSLPILITYIVKVTTRYVDLQPVGMGQSFLSISNPSFSNISQVHSVSCGKYALIFMDSQIYISNSSAKDQLTGASVAIKKIMKPFSTPVLSKRTYRELKLLKHIQHENVSRMYIIHTYS